MGSFDISIFSILGFLFDLFKNCKCSRRVVGLILPEKCGKSSMCNSLNSKKCVLIDLDEVLKHSVENTDKLQRLKNKNEYGTLTLLILKEAMETLEQIKQLHKFKRLVLLSSNVELMDGLRISYKCYVPSNNLANEIVGKLSNELKAMFENSRQNLIQNYKADVFGSFDELSGIISEKFELLRKL